MIVILEAKNISSKYLIPGDTLFVEFQGTPVLTREFDKDTIVDYLVIFVFADEAGRVLGGSFCVFFGVEKELPPEIRGAKSIFELSSSAANNILRTAPFEPHTKI